MAERRRGSKGLHEHLLRDVLGRGVVALQEMEGDGEDAVLVPFEDAALRLGVAAAAAFEGAGVELRLRHELFPHVCVLDGDGLRFLPSTPLPRRRPYAARPRVRWRGCRTHAGSARSRPPRTVAPITMAAPTRTRFLMMYCPSNVGEYGNAAKVSDGKNTSGSIVPGI